LINLSPTDVSRLRREFGRRARLSRAGNRRDCHSYSKTAALNTSPAVGQQPIHVPQARRREPLDPDLYRYSL